ncbi:Polycystin-2 [Hondaea fermentalgiana]|uniref:Polycystin-2 n=1 Tax=Hondaea fermentalgiana TaxID=2315210 RepID=A0A2R5G9N5_9STRA|nr:Polycystin-2 [Hondaea fermentalgiana]|eukprot:GBG24781.1 Polycystin-2 [Hondaea fermentalgiana]
MLGSPTRDAASLAEQQALAKFQAMDKDHDQKLSFDEWRALEASRGGMYDGPRFEGEARVPLDEELQKLERRIRHKNKCCALMAYICFLMIYVGINLCYPRTNRGELVAESREWIERQQWGEGHSIEDISSAADFWAWFDEVIVARFWNGEGTVLAFNKIVSGVTLAQRRKNFTVDCEATEAKFFADCPRWPQMNAFLSSDVDTEMSSMLQGPTPLVQGSRTNFIFEPLPVVQMTTSGARQYVNRSRILERTSDLRAGDWLNASTAETIVLLSLYNPNTHLYSSIQIRFLLQQTGGMQHDVIVWAGVFDTLSESVRLAGGMPWQFRVTLEILFVLAVTVKVMREAIEVFLCVKAALYRRKITKRGQHGGGGHLLTSVWEGMTDYATSFWNLVDVFGLTLAVLVIMLQVRVYVLRNEVVTYIASLDAASGELPDQVLLAAYLLKVANLDSLFDICNTMCLLVAFFRLFRCISFHGRLGIVSRTISRAWTTLYHFGTILFLVVCGYVVVGWIMFANKSEYFRTPISAFGSVVVLMTVGVDYSEFLDLVNTDQLTWWAFLPISMYYFGFMFIAAILLLNVLLGIVLGAYEEVQRGADDKMLDDTISADMHATWFQMKKALGCVKGKPHSSKVDPMCAFLTPDDAERVRPSLEATYNELITVHEVLSLPREGNVVPFRKLEVAPLVATFNYADLSQLFTDPVAMYLWALYGPGAPLGEPDVKPRDTSKEDAAALERARIEQVTVNQRRLESQIADLHAKLNLVLAALADDAAPATGIDAEMTKSAPKLLGTSKASPQNATHVALTSPRPGAMSKTMPNLTMPPQLSLSLQRNDHAVSPRLAEAKLAEPIAGRKTHAALQNGDMSETSSDVSSSEVSSTSSSTSSSGGGSRSSSSLRHNVGASKSLPNGSPHGLGTSPHQPKGSSRSQGSAPSAGQHPGQGIVMPTVIAHTPRKADETAGYGAKSEVEAHAEKDADENEHAKPSARSTQEHEGTERLAVSSEGVDEHNERRAEIQVQTRTEGYLGSEDGSEQEALEAAFEQLMDDLLADTGKCPMKMVANACKAHKPEIPWQLAKSLRRELGIIQRPDEVWTDHGTRKQVIRVWKRATTAEEFDILERKRQEDLKKTNESSSLDHAIESGEATMDTFASDEAKRSKKKAR